VNIAEFDGTCTTSYQSAIVTKALSCVLFELFDIEQYHYLETRSGVIQRYWHEFLLSFNCNYGPLLYHFRDKARWPKITILSYPTRTMHDHSVS